jgi:glycosyltransferase 2 family protein
MTIRGASRRDVRVTTTNGGRAVATGDAHEDSSAGAARGHGIQVFSAPSDAPRVRWKADLIAAAFVAVLGLLLIAVAGNGSTFDDLTLEFAGGLPGWLLWLSQAAYEVGVLYGIGLLIGVGIFAKGRLEVFRDMVLAALLAIGIVVGLTQLIDGRWPELAFFDLNQTRDTFPAFFVTTATAVQAAASPWLTAPMRKTGWGFVLAAVVASVVGTVTTVSDACGGLLVGLFAAAIIRYVFGTSAGLPSTTRVRDGLADLGVEMDTLAYFDEQPEGSNVLFGESTDGRLLFVNLLGRDSWSSRRWTRWWKKAWYQDHGAQYGSDRRQQIEHEALALLLAQRSGVSVPAFVAVGMTSFEDAVMVTEAFDHTLADVSVDGVDDTFVDACWEQLDKLHRADVSHGSIDAIHFWFDSAGEPELMGFANAAIHPTGAQKQQDVAAMLVMTTLGVGADRAISAARRAKGDAAIEAMLPLLQTAALNGRLRRRVLKQRLKIKDLRKQTATALGVEVPEATQLTRVTWKSVLMLGFVLFAVYTIIGGLADVGFDTVWQALLDARWGLVVLGLVLAAATNLTDATALAAVTPKRVPIGVTTVEQFAIGFVNIAVPSAAGRIAVNIRYFEKLGISAVTSTTTGAITGFLGFIAQAVLVVLTIVIGAGSIDLSQMQGGGDVMRLLTMAVVVFVGAVIIVALVPTWRRWAEDKLRTPMAQIGEAITTLKNPKSAALALGGSLATEVLYAAGFAMCVLAVGGSINLGQAIFINVTVSLFAGLMPIPGGVGVAEAGMTAGLTSIGVDPGVAVSAVLIYRLVSYYLPPLWGYVSLRWLTAHDYL